ncbi:hypothetical protein U2F26_27415 [Micromonospora sp. 4G57]|nr:hypothetical protein [Micromonospora sp. 4G57]
MDTTPGWWRNSSAVALREILNVQGALVGRLCTLLAFGKEFLTMEVLAKKHSAKVKGKCRPTMPFERQLRHSDGMRIYPLDVHAGRRLKP